MHFVFFLFDVMHKENLMRTQSELISIGKSVLNAIALLPTLVLSITVLQRMSLWMVL